MTELNGRIALVTGGAAGIGRLLTLELARRGAIPVVWDLDEEGIASVVAELGPLTGGRARGYRCDVRDRDAVGSVSDQVRADLGDPGIVVNNAGIVSGAKLLDLPDEAIIRTFEVNVLGLFWVTRAFLPAMIGANRGHIVTVASAAGLVGVARQTDYAASKHAAVGFNESLRVELHQSAPRVHTTVVCPYYIDTGMFEGVHTRIPSLLPILKPQDVARRIADAIAQDRAMLVLPPIVRLLPVLRVLPPHVFDRVMDLFGVNASMDHFVGHATATTPCSDQPEPAPVDRNTEPP
jgi:all-trans-retinol dehydrogenase (NAD+)